MDEKLVTCLAQLRSLFQQRIHDKHTALEVDRIGQALCTQATATIRGAMSEWNGANTRWHMPPEILALCCGYVRFRDLIRLSHVCRSWRSALVQFPRLWSDIVLTDSMRSPQDVLGFVLDRTGQHPLDIWFTRLGYDRHSTEASAPPSVRRMCFAVAEVLAPHMHHVRTLMWCDILDAPCFRLPAPLLTELRCPPARIPEDLFGTMCASLVTLHTDGICLPAACPTLSTVTTLSAELPPERRDTEHLHRLFDIFHNLQRLTLRGEVRFYADSLPLGPAPRSLRRLEIVDYDDSGHTIDAFVRWRTDALKNTRLAVSSLPLGGDASALFEGTVTMTIENGREESELAISTTTASGSKLVLHVSWFAEELETDAMSFIALFLRSGQDSLRKLRTLTLTLHVLFRVTAALIPLPALSELYVWIECPATDGISELPLAEKDAFAILMLQPNVELLTLDFVDPPASPDGLKEFLSAIVNNYPPMDPDSKRPGIELLGLPDAHLDACGLLDPELGTLDVATVLARADTG